MRWIIPKCQNKVIFKVSSPQPVQPLKQIFSFLLVPLHLDIFQLLASFLLYKATARQLISPAKLPTPLICLAHVSWTFSFFNRWNSNTVTDSLSFAGKITLSQDLLGRITNRAQNPDHSLLLLWRLSKRCSLEISLPQSKGLGIMPGFPPAEDHWWNNMGKKSLIW